MPTGVEIKGPCKILLSSLLWWPIQILYNLKTSDRSPKIVAYMNSLCNSTSYTMLKWLYHWFEHLYISDLLVFFYEDTPAETQNSPTQDTLRRNCTGARRLL